ncbi:thioredoxin family protein [Archaeoglobus neptunius]|uniref:thioredoxin family protein n=1 Tax=Archaeoglobus neptunius TaxID=2798580 RepID=UPI0019255B7E|nr:thioredoxin family protein [Archaeoglobus neptunius]
MKAIIFTSRYCPYCRYFERNVEKLREEIGIAFEVVDVDRNPELAERYDVTILPTLVIVENGEVVGGLMGYADYQTALEAIKEQISAFFQSNHEN